MEIPIYRKATPRVAHPYQYAWFVWSVLYNQGELRYTRIPAFTRNAYTGDFDMLHTFLWRGLTCPVRGWARLSDRGMRVWGGTADRPSVAWEGCPASPSRAESLST